MAVSVCERPRSHFVPVAGPANTTKRADLVLLRQGLDIAVNYFNFGQRENIKKLTVDAKKWCVQYYKGYHYAPKRATGLLKTFPNLFNLEVESHLRIVRAVMEESGHSQPEGATPRQLRRAERKAANSEAFPEFEEPTLASDEEMDEIVELRPRRSPEQPKVKPEMRVDAAMLRGSGLLQQLPEFLGQLARANLETETLLATNPEAVRFELDDDVAEEQPHIEVDVFSGVAEAQQRRHARRVILPGGRPFKLPGDEEGTEGDDESEPRSTGNDSDDSGNESDASTSTVASLRIRHRKRKAGVMTEGNGDDESPPNKIRIQYQHPTHTLAAFDLTERKIVRKVNPLANVEADPFVHLTRKRKGDDTFLRADSPERPSSSGSSSSTSSNKRIKIKVVNHGSASNSSQASSPAPSDASSSLNSRPSTPEFKIIRVYDSGASSSSSSSSSGSPSSTRSSPRIKIVRTTSRSISPTEPLTAEPAGSSSSKPNSPGSSSTKSSPRIKIIRGGNRSVSPTMPLAVIDSERGPEQLARPSSSSSMDSSGSGKSIKIKLVGKYSPKILARR